MGDMKMVNPKRAHCCDVCNVLSHDRHLTTRKRITGELVAVCVMCVQRIEDEHYNHQGKQKPIKVKG
jgi:hypothetical protein